MPVGYVDADGDGYGGAEACEADGLRPGERSPTADDCDDTNPAVNPSQREGCAGPLAMDGLDNDCDGLLDPACGQGWVRHASWIDDGESCAERLAIALEPQTPGCPECAWAWSVTAAETPTGECGAASILGEWFVDGYGSLVTPAASFSGTYTSLEVELGRVDFGYLYERSGAGFSWYGAAAVSLAE